MSVRACPVACQASDTVIRQTDTAHGVAGTFTWCELLTGGEVLDRRELLMSVSFIPTIPRMFGSSVNECDPMALSGVRYL
jgi:hypothetical protein